MPDDPNTLSFRLSAEKLNGAIRILLERGGIEQYPAAYQALVLERSRRELQSPPGDIEMTRDDFEALPHEVQQLLMMEQSR
jgi:hypothetical protein